MSDTRLRLSVVLLVLVAGACSAMTRGIGTVPVPVRQPSVMTDVVYGHKDGLALTLDVHRSARPKGAGVISIVIGGWQSSLELARIFTQAYPRSSRRGSPSSPCDTRAGRVSHVVDRGGHAAVGALHPSACEGVRCRSQPPWRVRQQRRRAARAAPGTTGDSGDPSAADAVLRESRRVAAVVANFPPTDLARWATQQPVFKFTDAEAAQFSPIRFVSSGSAPSLIVHGDADTAVPMDQGETMHAALSKAGVPASFVRSKARDTGSRAPLPRISSAPVPQRCSGSSSILRERRNRTFDATTNHQPH